jgi:hypothetical protein
MARHLAFFAPWREEYPNPRCFMCWKICASRETLELQIRSALPIIASSLLVYYSIQ